MSEPTTAQHQTRETEMTTKTATASHFARSADGTRIAYEAHGRGPALVLVDGALCQRTLGPSRDLTSALEGSFTVHSYDRRGRGESGAGKTAYHPDREVEDLVAVLEAAGGHAHVLGTSSGAALALAAAAQGAPIDRLVAYEAPFVVDGEREPVDADMPARTRELVAAGRRGEAVKLFMRTVGMPAPMVAVMPLFPMWKKLVTAAHTLAHDWDLCIEEQQGRPLRAGLYAGSTVPTLVLAGGKSPAYMKNAQQAIADAVPRGRYLEVAGQTHMVKGKALAPVVTEHLLAT
ncbi:alpha/beta fold hydrolase [Nocardioides houyundeii]|uniref:alpha/beta fold hydrolase n=1 Tax=Nocardioides houyundeii TaxID=2045452 RepID=UPI001F53264C|nr:alpha/beta hydrolase [Nocardioides houyundeii]